MALFKEMSAMISAMNDAALEPSKVTIRKILDYSRSTKK
jgi:hypothetical protein